MGVQSYSYNSAVQLTTHFNVSEFKCKCGKTHNTLVSQELVTMLEKIYVAMGCSQAIISSGYRCATHDRNVGGSGYGPHVDGMAADICFYDKSGKPINTKLISCLAQDMGFKGIANITSAYTWIHLDMKGRIYRGNEIYGYNTVTNDFYSYYGISKSQIQALTNNTTVTTTSTPVNNKDTTTANFKFTGKSDTQIKELQEILKSKGHTLVIDGVAGINTYNACKNYTIEKGDNGPLTRWVQERLITLGYNCGLADGKAGDGTMSAIKQFQKANNLGQGYLGGTDWYYLIK